MNTPLWWKTLSECREWDQLQTAWRTRRSALTRRLEALNPFHDDEQAEILRLQGRIREMDGLFDGAFEAAVKEQAQT